MAFKTLLSGLLLSFFFGCGLTGDVPGQALAQSDSLNAVFRQVNPAVVEIAGLKVGEGRRSSLERSVLGSGVVISREGRVLTAAHLVDESEAIAVRFLDGSVTKAEIVVSAGQADVALLQLKSVPSDLAVASLGDSDEAAIGDRIFVIGAPYGVRHSMTVGYIGGRRQSKAPCPGLSPFEFLQTDAAINQGNSGGPMLDMQGRVIGIVSRILSRSGGSEGLGFAVSSNTARRLLLDEDGPLWIGFEAALISGDLARAMNVPQEAGLLVQRVSPRSPAAQAGLQSGRLQISLGDKELLIGGDIVLEIQGSPVRASVPNICDLGQTIGGISRDESIEMTVLRRGEEISLTIER